MNAATEEPKCRLFLVAPSTGDVENLARCLKAALEVGDVGCVRVDQSGDSGAMRRVVEAFLPLCRAWGAAVILAQAVELVQTTGADGVELADSPAGVKAARQVLGPEAIVGGMAGASRHRAMEFAEAGVDYVALRGSGPDGEPLAAWWAEIATVPAVAADPVSLEEAAWLARRRVDFVIPPSSIWETPVEAGRIASAYRSALAEAWP
jgi:thiamine-phosphate pyrophosphorylase